MLASVVPLTYVSSFAEDRLVWMNYWPAQVSEGCREAFFLMKLDYSSGSPVQISWSAARNFIDQGFGGTSTAPPAFGRGWKIKGSPKDGFRSGRFGAGLLYMLYLMLQKRDCKFRFFSILFPICCCFWLSDLLFLVFFPFFEVFFIASSIGPFLWCMSLGKKVEQS